jgi:stage III sporulation protein AC
MTVQILFKIGAVGILVALLNQILKHSGRDEHAYIVSMVGLIIVLSWIIPYITELFNEIMELCNIGG